MLLFEYKLHFAKDTVSSATLHCPISRDGTDRQDGQGDDEICDSQHEKSLEKTSMTDDKTCNTHTHTHVQHYSNTHTANMGNVQYIAMMPPPVVSTSDSPTCAQEEDDAEHGQDGGHHHPKECVEFAGIVFGSVVSRRGPLPGVCTLPQHAVCSMWQEMTPLSRHDLKTGS